MAALRVDLGTVDKTSVAQKPGRWCEFPSHHRTRMVHKRCRGLVHQATIDRSAPGDVGTGSMEWAKGTEENPWGNTTQGLGWEGEGVWCGDSY